MKIVICDLKIMSVYTRTGDFGETSLFGGKRVLKCDDIVDLYGLIDELNSFIGLLVSEMAIVEVQNFLEEIQRDLFTIGSFVAGKSTDLSDIGKRVKEIEARIDTMDKSLPPLRTFILPGGSNHASLIHVARSVSRRVERKAVCILTVCDQHPNIEKKHMEKVIQYLNRLSDFLFVLARFVNQQEHGIEVVWKSEKT